MSILNKILFAKYSRNLSLFSPKTLPEEGVKIFAGLPHTHQLGTAMRLRHLRKGQEQPVPFQDRFYSPNYQTMRSFEVNLKPVSLEPIFFIAQPLIFKLFPFFYRGTTSWWSVPTTPPAR